MFKDIPKELKNNSDVLNLTQKAIVKDVYEKYLEAGADIIETNTFNGQVISQSDYGLEKLVYEMNYQSAKLAREAAAKYSEITGEMKLVAGAIGPTNRTCSISPKVEDPAFRNVTYMEIKDAYKEQI